MTDAELVLRKLAVLEEHLGRAARRRPPSLDALKNDDLLQDALAMSLLVAIQEAIDVAFHIVADEGWGLPASNAEAFDRLAQHSVIDQDLAARMAGATGLRNRIAHGYASVDVDRLWQELPTGLESLQRFAQRVAQFLGSTD
jgi:uncharacterized protein YutE (UPF0331/DUF86 family)